MLEKVCVAFGGRTLVLFTSYEMMSAVAGLMRGRLADNAIELLVQGEGLSRESIVARLRNGENRCVAFGTQSFWEGVDVAGSGLSCVVIARLPFAQKGDPIVEARCDMIEKNGGSSFREYILPEAAIRFQQGFGRLIRTKSDRGVVIVADPRLVVKNYGGSFRKSIPATVRPVSDMSELMSCIEEFLLSSEG
jgi:ATP-dependent DNA helicase DinG